MNTWQEYSQKQYGNLRLPKGADPREAARADKNADFRRGIGQVLPWAGAGLGGLIGGLAGGPVGATAGMGIGNALGQGGQQLLEMDAQNETRKVDEQEMRRQAALQAYMAALSGAAR